MTAALSFVAAVWTGILAVFALMWVRWLLELRRSRRAADVRRRREIAAQFHRAIALESWAQGVTAGLAVAEAERVVHQAWQEMQP